MGWLAAMAALVAQAGEAPPDLSWLAGYWLSCDGGREVSETWSGPRGGIMLGSSLTIGRSGRLQWEQMRIGPAEGGGIAFFAQPSGQAAAAFALVRTAPAEAAFENAAHDFPQRIVYRRDGARLTARIEGRIDGEARSSEWHYRAAPLNARCGAAGGGGRGASGESGERG